MEVSVAVFGYLKGIQRLPSEVKKTLPARTPIRAATVMERAVWIRHPGQCKATHASAIESTIHRPQSTIQGMDSGPVIVIDYDAGNLRSVARALEHVGAEPVVSADPVDIARAGAVVLPGVGAAADTMFKLRERNLVEPIREYIAEGRPFLGVCMGLHALLERSEEGGGQDCLGVLPGEAKLFAAANGLKVPHMGWNTVEWLRPHPVTEGIPSGSYFYFVHSYYPWTDEPGLPLGETEYGVTFPSVFARGYTVATQFHAEKSGNDGLRLYRNFVDWARSGVAAGESELPISAPKIPA